ncbi:hypothetical protein A3Q34_06150 [Colwellia sp. PAMC 20917]|uniref:hypothetical protein n=1 Tax=Colwellia sp. PAMC 20917 TaxID=1816218 RepID=UPI000878184A|nr:hypothetical protein [Colwellia sp. PAMC 20917]AOW76476.1 hypothetical protein A3Q34_06150 [Colwellia sp. PAMC 20917]
MINIDFLFLMEHEDREGAALYNITERLSKKGYYCVILSTEFHSHRYGQYNPKCIVFPYSIDDKTWPVSFFRNKKWRESQLVSLNWEQLLSNANKEFKKPKSDVIKSFFKHLAWDESFKDFLCSSGVRPTNVEVIGNPLHELLFHETLNSSDLTASLKKEFAIPHQADIYFFPMNYGWAFSSDKTIKAKIKMGYDENIAWQYRDYSKRCLNKFVKFITKAAIVNTTDYFIIRPHPSISIEQYELIFKQLKLDIPKNILITKSYSIKEWISVAKLIGSSWSTSVWDSIKIGKIGFLFTPEPRPEWLNTFWNNKVTNLSSVEEFMVLTQEKGIDKESPIGIIDEIVDWLISNIGGDHYTTFTPLNKSQWLYSLRSRFREFSMKHLNASFINKGMQRDYFKPINTKEHTDV